MAKRAKPAGRARTGGNFEVQDESGAANAAPAEGLERMLLVITLVALLVGLVLSQMELSSSYGKGLL